MTAAPGPDVDDLDGGDRRSRVLAESFLIVARDNNGVIGNGPDIPWRHRGDMRHFRDATLGCALIVGRTTFDTLPAAMPGRDLVVVTSRPLPEGATALPAASLDEAVEVALRDTGARAIAFAGGPRIYAEALTKEWLRRAVVTEVSGAHAGDAFMPPLGREWIAEPPVPLASREGEPAASVVTHRR
jgi:dihydrofolate reductase